METLQDIRHRIRGTADLHAVVRTMKSLAAVNIRQYEKAMLSLGDYRQSVELGLRGVLRLRPLLPRTPEPRRGVVLILGSDQGMAGRFNEVLLDFVEEELRDQPRPEAGWEFWAAGAKMIGGVEDRFRPPREAFPLPASSHQITATVQEVVLRFEAACREGGETRLLLLHNEPNPGAGYRRRQAILHPHDRRWMEAIGGQTWPGRALPAHTLPAERLLSALLREHLFISLFEAFAASLAAENAARLAAMQQAEKKIEEMTLDLTARFNHLRQTQITEELLDVISGFEALSN